jgi:lipoyl-dependent peroxiredoxin
VKLRPAAIIDRKETVMAADKQAWVEWRGDLTDGHGTIERVGSGAFGPLPVTWAARTGDEGTKTSPEELIAAAHASCFSMALSLGLGKQGAPPRRLAVSATVTFVPGTGITKSVIDVEGDVPGIDDATFQKAAEETKDGCPVSKALQGNVELSITARLTGS